MRGEGWGGQPHRKLLLKAPCCWIWHRDSSPSLGLRRPEVRGWSGPGRAGRLQDQGYGEQGQPPGGLEPLSLTGLCILTSPVRC